MSEKRGFPNPPGSGKDDRGEISARLEEGSFERSWHKAHLRIPTLGFIKLKSIKRG